MLGGFLMVMPCPSRSRHSELQGAAKLEEGQRFGMSFEVLPWRP